MNQKTLLLQTLILTAIILLGIGGFVYIVDPYQRYRANSLYSGIQRFEIAGVAANHDYDAFITGSSMAMNHYPEQVDSLWGWKTKNFSIMGATDDDYEVVLPYIISKGKTNNIILCIDNFSFARSRGAIPKYLYDDNVLNDYKYLWNFTSLQHAISMLLGNGQSETNLYHFDSPYGRKELQDHFEASINKGYERENFNLDSMKYRFDRTLFKVVKDTPYIQWHIYFPPYSIGEYIIYDLHDNLEANLGMRNYMANKLLSLKNVELYDFQCRPIITNLNSYMDLRHHSHAINRMIIQSIHDRNYIVNDSIVNVNSQSIRILCRQYKDSLMPN